MKNIETPYWLLEESKLKLNLEILKEIKERSKADIILALKGYALWKSFPLVSSYLDGCCASGLNEALLSNEEFKKETHTYSPAFKKNEFNKIAKISSHISFNSINQFNNFYKKAKEINPNISLGLRINPEYSVAPKEIYNPCGLYSRLGILSKDMPKTLPKECEGLHFHALCEQDSDVLEEVLKIVEKNFKNYLPQIKWFNFGGGHHITKKGYNREKLIELIKNFGQKYNLKIYLELGEAVGWESGDLITSVLDIVENKIKIAILDISAEAHMPDTIIMPYKAKIGNQEGKYKYRLAGNSCLAGDIMGDYSFKRPLKIGDKIVFKDQMHYTMVKATTFNGVALPKIVIKKENNEYEILKEFDYYDFKGRLS